MRDLPVTKRRSIKECQRDEFWLRDKIFEDPSILRLGNLQGVIKEKPLSRGRLDILLENPDDDSMYAVEIQLGETDESHIVRTIEYWDRIKRLWPKRNHTAVLVAETITSRFFNVVSLLSQGVPIIGIQAKIVEVGEMQALDITKIIDSYEEPELMEATKQYDEKYWSEKHPAALDCTNWYRNILAKTYGEIPIKYFESYIALTVGGTDRVWVNQRKRNNRAFIEVKPAQSTFQEIVDYLNSEDFSFNTREDKIISFNVNLTELQENATIHEWFAPRIVPEATKVS